MVTSPRALRSSLRQLCHVRGACFDRKAVVSGARACPRLVTGRLTPTRQWTKLSCHREAPWRSRRLGVSHVEIASLRSQWRQWYAGAIRWPCVFLAPSLVPSDELIGDINQVIADDLIHLRRRPQSRPPVSGRALSPCPSPAPAARGQQAAPAPATLPRPRTRHRDHSRGRSRRSPARCASPGCGQRPDRGCRRGVATRRHRS